MPESQDEKVARYFAEGKVRVISANTNEEPGYYESAHVEVHGSKVYNVRYRHETGVWSCDCPARKKCVHLIAAEQIFPHLAPTDLAPVLGHPDEDLDALIGERRQPMEESDLLDLL